MSKWVQLGVVEWAVVVLEEEGNERRIARILDFVTSLLSRRVFYLFARSVFFRASWLNHIKFMAKSITSLCIHSF